MKMHMTLRCLKPEAMRLFLPAVYLVLHAFVANGDTRYFLSNESGMQLRQIAASERATHAYYLEVNTEGLEQKRILFENGVETRRNEISFYENRLPKSEKEIEGGKLKTVTSYDRSRRVEEERVFADGEPVYRTLYDYPANQGRYASVTYAKDETELYREEFLLGNSGELRQIKKTWPDGQYQVTSFVYASSKIRKELQSADDEMTIGHYNSYGQLRYLEVWRGQTLVRSSVNTFDESGRRIELSDTDDKIARRLVKEVYDKDGRLTSVAVEQEKKVIEELAYAYDDSGKRIRTTRKSDAGLEEWIFGYTDEGEIASEDYYVKGRIEKKTSYKDGSIAEERVYEGGKLIVVAYYDKQKKIKEEFYENGILVRTRETGTK